MKLFYIVIFPVQIELKWETMDLIFLPVVENNASVSGKVKNLLEFGRRFGNVFLQRFVLGLQIVSAGEDDDEILEHVSAEVVDKVLDGVSLLGGVPADPGDEDNGVWARS